MKQQDTSTTPPPPPPQLGAVDSSLLTDGILDANQINRLGLHVIEDAVVTEAADEIVPTNDDPEDGIGSSSHRHDIIPPEAEEAVVTGVIKSVNCRGKEIRTSTIIWSIGALLIVIVAIVVPTTVILSGKNTPQEDDQSPSTPPMIIDEEEMERQAKLLSIATSLSSPLDLENPSSPQRKALEWLLGPANSRIKFKNVTIDEINVDAETVVIERYVMATLYYSLGGEEWTKKWGVGNSDFEESTGLPVRLWSRDGLIQTDLNGLVTGLFLSDNNLNGTIPPEIQHLQRLQYFHIQENNLVRGNVPMEMEKMSSLTGFWAQDTNIIGEIDFLCDIRERGDNVTAAAAAAATTVVTDDECKSCGFQVDLENVQCSCCTCCL
jgi:hypothetical protein